MQIRYKEYCVNYALIAANILYFIFLSFQGRTEYDMDMMLRFGAMYEPLVIENGEYYRFLTACFMHFGIEHLVNNMLVLFVIGGYLEKALGHLRYLLFYILAGIGANIISFYWHLGTADFVVSAGASGAVFGVVGGLIFAILRNRGRLGDLSMRQILVMTVLSVYLGMSESGVDNAAHLGGLLCGFVLAVLLYHPKRHHSQNTGCIPRQWEIK
ncbi:MAG: rhomboid family intramembrane serine protease [Eubacteriales bacterium]|nr:rhomboid family intramembrane serine protease [Eubacteriales bacterium]